MAIRDLLRTIFVTPSLAPAARTNGTFTGATVDLRGYDAAVITVAFGTWTDGTHTPSIIESIDGVTFTTVAASNIENTLSAVSSSAGSNNADGAFTPSALQSTSGLATDNMEITGILDSADIVDADIEAGLYDNARIDFYVCNWADLTQGTLQLRRGWLGEVVLSGGHYVAELRGLHDRLRARGNHDGGDMRRLVHLRWCRYAFALEATYHAFETGVID